MFFDNVGRAHPRRADQARPPSPCRDLPARYRGKTPRAVPNGPRNSGWLRARRDYTTVTSRPIEASRGGRARVAVVGGRVNKAVSRYCRPRRCIIRPRPTTGSVSRASISTSHSGQTTRGWTRWPQGLCRRSTGWSGRPVHWLPHCINDTYTGNNARPLAVSRYSLRLRVVGRPYG
jgi:hypothetical protein